MQFLQNLILSSEVDQKFKAKPQVCDENGTKWLIGFNHLICDNYEYEQIKDGIDQSKAYQLLEQDILSYLIILEKEFNKRQEKYEKSKFYDLNSGCQYLLLSIFFTTGRFSQYSKVVEFCSKNQLYEALKYNNRKSKFNTELGGNLQQYANQERQFFQKHFLSDGIPKNENEWKVQLIQATEEDLESANRLINCRFENCNQQLICAEINDFQHCNYKDPKWMEFLRDQEGEKYNFISYNEQQQKWFPVEVEDQSNLIIGYSHICTEDEANYQKVGLTDGQVNYLFLADYNNNIIRVKRYLRQEFPQYEFENLLSWVQLFLIDISFRNYTFQRYKEAIQFALEGNLDEAIAKSDVYYPPSLNVNAHYQLRIGKLWEIFVQIEENYKFQEIEKNSIQDLEKLNNIVGVKITKSGYNFLVDDQAETKINFKDLVTFLRVYYDPEFQDFDLDVYFSLDPEIDDNEMEGEHQKKVYIPEYLEGTEVGEVLYQSDFILKQMSLGISSNGNQKQKFDYGDLNIQPIYQRDPEFFNRIFLKIGNSKINIVEDKSNDIHSLIIERIVIIVDAREQGKNGEEQIITDPNNAASIFVNQFTQGYDQISLKYPIFRRLKEVLMANYLAKHMHTKNLQLDFEAIDELYQVFLIKNYQQYQSPNLSMTFQTNKGKIEVSGGIDGGIQDVQQEVENILQQLNEINIQIIKQNENSQSTELSISRCSSVDSITSVDTTTSESKIQRKPIICKKCHKNKLDTDDEIKQKNCINCQNKKCQRCQNESNKTNVLVIIEGVTICKNCLKCTQCGKLNADKIQGANFYHGQCIKWINQSKLREELLSLIQIKLHTIEHKGENNSKMKYLIFEEFKCLTVQNYTGYIYGYHHVQFKDPKLQLDPKKHRITQQQAQEYLIKEFESAETEVIKQFIQHGNKNVNGVPENVRLLLTFANFILKDLSFLRSQFFNPDFHTLYLDLQDLKCSNKAKHTCTVKSKITVGLDFFNDRFHRKDGSVREKTIMGTIKKYIPASRC